MLYSIYIAITGDDVAKTISNQPIAEGTAENSMVFFLPMIFTVNAEIMQPGTAPRVSKDVTQEISCKFKRTGYPASSPFINKGMDGDAHPIFKPTDNEPRFPKIKGFEELSFNISQILFFYLHRRG